MRVRTEEPRAEGGAGVEGSHGRRVTEVNDPRARRRRASDVRRGGRPTGGLTEERDG
ncbi:hypothetical protein [Haloprofundus halobius]|uniref:hypothetical protein n=1 Tax=Haloprofundus halobius TaxID=2876194 RepID=UPI001CCB020E|nr:hypothetical protein [Haloprofundus halobius]